MGDIAHPEVKTLEKKHIPLFLTTVRLVLPLPILILLTLEFNWCYWLSAVLLLLAALTDKLDGYFARKWSVTSSAGAFLDTTADKVVILTVLVFLCFQRKVDPYSVIIFMYRDLLITGLRAIAAEKGIVIYSQMLGKSKATLQFAGVFFILIGIPMGYSLLEMTGLIMIWIAVILSIVSGFGYARECYNKKIFFS